MHGIHRANEPKHNIRGLTFATYGFIQKVLEFLCTETQGSRECILLY